MEFIIYWLIGENYKNTYVGFSDNIQRRIKEHKKGIVKSTVDFGRFRCLKLEVVNNINTAREREKYWKSHAGRKKLQKYFEIIIKARSSNG